MPDEPKYRSETLTVKADIPAEIYDEIHDKPEVLCYHKYVIRHDSNLNMYYNCITCGRVVFFWSADARKFPWPVS